MTSNNVFDTNPPAPRVVVTNEKVTGPPAAEMLRRSGIATSDKIGISILDNACGGGILTAEALALAKQHPDTMKLGRIVAGDIDEKMLGYVRSKREDPVQQDEWRRVGVMNIDQQDIPFPEASFTHVFSNMGIFFCKDDEKALAESYRVLSSSGVAGFTSWKSIAWWSEIAQPAIAQFIPEAPALPSPGQLFPSRGWSDPAAIPAKLGKAGFSNVQVSEYSFTPDVEAVEFAEATGVLVKIVTKRLWSEEENAKYADQVEPALLKYLNERYEAGRWTGKMTAIISVGKKE